MRAGSISTCAARYWRRLGETGRIQPMDERVLSKPAAAARAEHGEIRRTCHADLCVGGGDPAFRARRHPGGRSRREEDRPGSMGGGANSSGRGFGSRWTRGVFAEQHGDGMFGLRALQRISAACVRCALELRPGLRHVRYSAPPPL